LQLWRRQQNIILARSRSNRKNDYCFVEQKNYASVRKIVGYRRFLGEKDVAALQTVYSAYDNLLNYFYPCQKLISKERFGSKVKKTMKNPKLRLTGLYRMMSFLRRSKTHLFIASKANIELMSEMVSMQKSIDKLPTLADPVPEFATKRTMKPLLFGSHSLIF
jgi:hypothetical protein